MIDLAAHDLIVDFQAPAAGRLDVVLTAWLHDNPIPERAFSRSQLAIWITEGRVTVGKRILTKTSTKVQERTRIRLAVPPPPQMELVAEDHEFEVLYADDAILVINKPVGLRVHPSPEDLHDSLVAGILGRQLTLAPAGGALRPGVVHRLDKTTSGVMLLARTDPAYFGLVAQFKARTIQKQYVALTVGHLPHMQGTIDAPIARDPAHRKRFAVVPYGKTARSDYAVIERTPVGDWVELTLHTGRTHQLRVHLRHIGAPIVGDTLYGGALSSATISKLSRHSEGWGGEAGKARRVLQECIGLLQDYPGNCLHARSLAIEHPITGASMQFEAPPPERWLAIADAMRRSRSSS